MNKRWSIGQPMRKKVFEKSGGRCAYCGKELSMEHLSYEEADGCFRLRYPWHVDHIIPVSKGGNYKIDNLIAACPRCNMTKGAK